MIFLSLFLLVDGQLNAKIADLELGGDEAGVSDEETNRTSISRVSSGHQEDHLIKRSSFKRRNKSSARGDNFLSTWLAPEVFSCIIYY